MELAHRAVEVSYVAQGAGGLVGQARLAEEEHPVRLSDVVARGGQVVLGPQQRLGGGVLAASGGQASSVDDAKEGPLPWGGERVPVAVDGCGGEVESLLVVSEVDGLVRHRPQHVSGHRRIAGLGRELHRLGEVPLRCCVLASVERHPPRQVGEFAGCGEEITANTLVGEFAPQVGDDVGRQVLHHGRPGVGTASALVHLGEQGGHVADGCQVAGADPPGCGRAARAAPLGHALPPVFVGQRECGHRVDRHPQGPPAFHVHVGSPEFGQRAQRIRVPVGFLGCGRDQADLVQRHDPSAESAAQRLGQEGTDVPGWLTAVLPLRDARLIGLQELVMLGRHPPDQARDRITGEFRLVDGLPQPLVRFPRRSQNAPP
ncbi:hypothetical protein ACFQ0T_35775 [Kitasatospora gansuensis]